MITTTLTLPKKLPPQENPFEVINFSKDVSRYFLRRKLQVSVSPFISKAEKDKNFYIAHNYFKTVFNGTAEYEIEDEEKKKEFFNQLKSESFWQEVIDYLFDKTDDRMISYYGQTFNGVILFLEKRYYFLKNVKGKADQEKEVAEFIKSIKKYKLEEMQDLYLCLIAKIYKTFKPYTTGYKNKYYQYSQHFIEDKKSIRIKPEFFLHSEVFRGVFAHYLPEFKTILQKLKLETKLFINLEEFENLCETKGIVKPNLSKVDVNELVEKAAREFFSKILL